MRLLQRYILAELVRVFVFLICVMTVLLVFVGIFREATENGLGPYQITQILPYIVPALLPFTIPATLLLTVTVVYGRLAGDNEITAAKAAGVNVLSLLAPAFALGIILSIGSFALTDQAIPWAMTNIQRVVTNAMEELFMDVLKTQKFYSHRDRRYSITVHEVAGGRLIDATINWRISDDSRAVVQAQEGTLDFDLDKKELNVHLVNVQMTVPGQVAGILPHFHYQFPLPKEIQNTKPRHMSVREMQSTVKLKEWERKHIEYDREVASAFAMAAGDFSLYQTPRFEHYNRGIRYRSNLIDELHAEFHSRYAMASSCMFFMLLGGPFSILHGRRQFLATFVMCFVPILLIYYPLVFLMLNLSKEGVVDPRWATWVANAVLLSAGVFCLRRVMKH